MRSQCQHSIYADALVGASQRQLSGVKQTSKVETATSGF
jgi:hypothetical protein